MEERLSPVKRALLEIRELRARLAALEAAKTPQPIAIIGMGMRLPGGVADADSMAALLWSGRDAIGLVPPDRWNAEALYHPDPDAPGRLTTQRGGFIDMVDQFDAEFFGISPREAVAMDPQQRLMLEVCWTALEDAGHAMPRLTGSRTGVYLGVSSSDYGRALFARRELIDAYYASGASASVVAGRISYCLGLQGPSLAVDTACSASLVALHLACQALRAGECDMALAGGVNLILAPEPSISFTKARMMAPDGRCKAFDAAADGYVRGEGVGVIVLRPLADADAAGDRILAVIRGSAVNQDGRSNGLTAPNGPAQEAVIRAALAQAEVAPSLVSYVEAHGTGTPLGDPIEMGALQAVFADGRTASEPLYVGSVKTNIGHLEAAAGVAGVIKVVLSLQRREIPPSLHFQTGNPRIDWRSLPIAVPTSAIPWRPANGRYLAGVSSFAFSGTNAHVVLEAAPPARASAATLRSHLLPLAAPSRDRLAALAERYAASLERDLDPGDVCFTAATGRTHFRHRLVVLGERTDTFREAMDAFACGRPHPALVSGPGGEGVPMKIAFVFSGQGSQYSGMGLGLYEAWPAFRQALDRCSQLLSPHCDLLALLEGTGPGGAAAVDQTRWAQPAIFAIEYALASLWRSWGVQPSVVMGHSLGEYVAACWAGTLELEDALKLVVLRGELTGSLSGAMAAVFAEPDQIEAAVAASAGCLSVAAWNGPAHAVLSGERDALDPAMARLAAAGIPCVDLRVSDAAHSPLVEAVVPAFRRALASCSFAPPNFEIVSNVTGALAADAITRPDYWVDHLRRTVQFARSVETLVGEGVTHVIEIGPQPVLLGMIEDCLPQGGVCLLPSLRRERGDAGDPLESVQRLYVDGADIAWDGLFTGQRCQRVSLPRYPFRRRRYWLDAPPRPDPWPQLQRALDRHADLVPTDLLVDDYPGIWASLERLTIGHILSVCRNGWVFMAPGETLGVEDMLARCAIVPAHYRLVGRWLDRLVGAGLLTRHDGRYTAVAALPAPDLDVLWRDAEARLVHNRPMLDYIRHCSALLDGVLRGCIDPLETIFPGGSPDLSRALYERSPIMRWVNCLASEALGAVQRAAGVPIRVLEVGAGTGATSASLLPMLDPGSTYLFTDNCDLFLDRARDRFGGLPGLTFSKFDFDRDEAEQGLAQGGFEVVVAANAVHASVDLPAALRRLLRLLAPGGVLILVEATADFAWLDLTIGVIQGWQHFADAARSEHPLLLPTEWQRVLVDSGFSASAAWPREASPCMVLGQHLILARAPGELSAAAPPVAPAVAAVTGEPVADRSADVPALRVRVEQATANDRLDLLREFVRVQVMGVLRRPDEDPPGLHDRLMDLGVDSLMAVRLRARLGESLGLGEPLPATLLFDHPTVASLADVLAECFGSAAPSPIVPVEPIRVAIPQTDALDLDAVAALSEAEIEALVLRRLQEPLAP